MCAAVPAKRLLADLCRVRRWQQLFLECFGNMILLMLPLLDSLTMFAYQFNCISLIFADSQYFGIAVTGKLDQMFGTHGRQLGLTAVASTDYTGQTLHVGILMCLMHTSI